MFLQRRCTATKHASVASLNKILLSVPEMLFVMIGCADDMPWLITTLHGANEIAAPIRFDWTLATQISSAADAEHRLHSALRFVIVLSVVVNELRYRSASLSWF
jgi:hypothetical protein